jgi:serine/threonine protein kinase
LEHPGKIFKMSRKEIVDHYTIYSD